MTYSHGELRALPASYSPLTVFEIREGPNLPKESNPERIGRLMITYGLTATEIRLMIATEKLDAFGRPSA